jgi:hypothetical protein
LKGDLRAIHRDIKKSSLVSLFKIKKPFGIVHQDLVLVFFRERTEIRPGECASRTSRGPPLIHSSIGAVPNEHAYQSPFIFLLPAENHTQRGCYSQCQVVAAVRCSPRIARERSFTPVSPGRHSHQQFVAMRVRMSV